MAWFLNKTTGLKWEITSEDVINRISKDENYKILQEEEEKDIKATTTKTKNSNKK